MEYESLDGQGSPSKWLGDRIQPIASLNPYQSRWAIKARVVNKSEVKVWKNDRGEGKLFSVDLLDKQGGQIKATMFKEAVDRFFPIFEPNKTYLISRGLLKLANKKFSVVPNDYEMTLNVDAVVEQVDDDGSISEQKYHFQQVAVLPTLPDRDVIDIIGVVTSVGPVRSITSQQSHKQMIKRNVVLADNTLCSVELTLWGELAEKYGEDMLHQVVAVKGCRVTVYVPEVTQTPSKDAATKGVTLTTLFGTRLFVCPAVEETTTLQTWWAATGKEASFELISKQRGTAGGEGDMPVRRFFDQLSDDEPNVAFDKPFSFVTRCTPIYFRHDTGNQSEKPPWYNACPAPKCNRKVTFNEMTKDWHCENCNKSFATAPPRYILSLRCVDASGDLWLTAFDDVAKFLLGHSAQIMSEFKQGNEKAYEQVYKDANFKSYLFKCRAKLEAPQKGSEGGAKIRYHVLAATAVNYRQEGHMLLQEIGLMMAAEA